MNPLALAAVLFLALAPASVANDFDPSFSIATPDSKWKMSGQQKTAVLDSADHADSDPASQAPSDAPLRAWAKRCPAIDELRSAPFSQKRGVGVPSDTGASEKVLANLRPFWYYTWGTKPVTGTRLEFTPMIRDNGANNVDGNFQGIKGLWPAPKFVLGYDEPDQQRIAAEDPVWAQRYAPDPRLPSGAVSPASSSVDWFKDFIKSESAKKFPLIAVHLYEDVQTENPDAVDRAVKDFKKRIETLESQTGGKPIWVTGFGLTTQGATSGNRAKFRDEQAACFMAQVIPFLEKHAMRYAWFSPNPGVQTPQEATLPDALWNRDGSLTPLGELYRQQP